MLEKKFITTLIKMVKNTLLQTVAVGEICIRCQRQQRKVDFIAKGWGSVDGKLLRRNVRDIGSILAKLS